MKLSSWWPEQDEDNKGSGEEALFLELHHRAIFPRRLQYLEEANELFRDIANPFFLPIYRIDTNCHSQIDLAATRINSWNTKRNGLAMPKATILRHDLFFLESY